MSKPFLRARSSSLGNMFKKKQAHSYRAWAEEGDVLLEEEHTPARPLDSALEEGGRVDMGVEAVDLQQGVSLVECFYLGAYDMEGRSIRGRGCIDTPAGELWLQTQEDPSKKRRRRASGADDGFRPRYVKLVAVKNELEMRDIYSNEKVTSFRYRLISFVGTHPKYDRLFAFVAHEKGKKEAWCYAFKCEDKLSAYTTAQQLDGVFHQRCKELETQKSPSPASSMDISVVTVQ